MKLILYAFTRHMHMILWYQQTGMVHNFLWSFESWHIEIKWWSFPLSLLHKLQNLLYFSKLLITVFYKSVSVSCNGFFYLYFCWLVGGFWLQSGWLVETAGSGSDCHLVRDRTCHGPQKRKVHASIRYIEKYSDVEKKHPSKCMILWGIKKKYKCQVYDC